MIHALILGELAADPGRRTASNGTDFATATIRAGVGNESIFIGVSTFSASAVEKLMALRKGDGLAATGPLEANSWTDREGNARSGWRLTAGQVMTAYEASKRRKAATESEADDGR